MLFSIIDKIPIGCRRFFVTVVTTERSIEKTQNKW